MRRSFTAAVVATGLLAGCASQGELEPGEVYDPIEPANRLVFAVNETLDTFVLQPTAYVYKEAVPDPVRDMVRSFLDWLKTPVVLANDLFQGDWDGAGVTASRFVANAPFFGFVDNATGLGLEQQDEDFGQTLAVYGTGDGPYIVLPLLGPSNARDTVGMVVDHFLDPINYVDGGPLESPRPRTTFQIARKAVGAVDFRARNFQAINELKQTSVDYYARVRTIYKQRRDALVTDGTPPLGAGRPSSTSGEFEQYVPGGQPAENAGPKTPSS